MKSMLALACCLRRGWTDGPGAIDSFVLSDGSRRLLLRGRLTSPRLNEQHPQGGLLSPPRAIAEAIGTRGQDEDPVQGFGARTSSSNS